MYKVQQQKKREIASSLVELLKKLKLEDTADVLIQQASLLHNKNVEEDIREIMQDTILVKKQKEIAVQNYCKYSIQNYLRQNKIDQALQIYQVILPIYCPAKIQEFSLLFAENYEKESEKITILLESFIEQPKILPENRAGCLNIKNQIWHLKSFGTDLLLVDCFSNAYIVEDNKIRSKKQKIHNQKIFALTVSQQKFASGGTDKTVKIWDKNITLLYCIQIHKDRINSIIMYGQTVISFDNEAVICVHHIPSTGLVQRQAIFKTTNSFLDAKYVKDKNKIIGASKAGKLGQLCFVNIDKKRIEKIVEIQKRIYGIEISVNQKIVFANVAPAQIRAYSLSSKHELLCKFTGFMQTKNLMRMSQGDKQGKYLAVTSEQGTVRVYSIKEQEQVLKLLGQSKKSINCVLWRDQQLYFGCDGGKLQHWVNVGVNRATLYRTNQTEEKELQVQNLLTNMNL